MLDRCYEVIESMKNNNYEWSEAEWEERKKIYKERRLEWQEKQASFRQ